MAIALIAVALLAWNTYSAAFVIQAPRRIKHIVIIVQENRSFDNLFHGFPGADTADVGIAHDGTRVNLQPVSLKAPYDLSNSFRDFAASYDNGKMDGWDLRRVAPIDAEIPLNAAQYPQYAYVPHDEIREYLKLARQYVLADRMFQSNIDQSFAAHLYLIAGQAARATDVPNGRPWGCDASYGTVVQTLNEKRQLSKLVPPCFDLPTLGDELDAAGKSWRYYAPQIVNATVWARLGRSGRAQPNRPRAPDFGQLWTSYDAIAHDRYGPQWVSSVVHPQTRILSDIRNGYLANVTWVVPDWKDSDHSGSRSDTGPSWVGSIVNTIGESPFWNSTAIFIVWDDSGGWYDHVRPPQLDFDGLGVRVPLIVVSPYARRGYVSHVQYEFGSIVQFVETVFNLGRLADSDRRSNSLSDCFDFRSAPRRFEAITTRFAPKTFFARRPSTRAPDDD